MQVVAQTNCCVEENALKNVRLIYKKTGRSKFISHLDLNRLMIRVLKRSGLPIWFTEGFNPHAFITFALPLSLGFESRYDVMDFRVTDLDLSYEEIFERLKSALPPDIVAVKVYEPTTKPKIICFADFEVYVECDDENYNKLSEFLNGDEIIVEKTTKKKEVKTFNVKGKIKQFSIEKTETGAKVYLCLPAGNIENINPTIIFDSAEKSGIEFDITDVIRDKIYDENLNLFV